MKIRGLDRFAARLEILVWSFYLYFGNLVVGRVETLTLKEKKKPSDVDHLDAPCRTGSGKSNYRPEERSFATL